MNNLYPTESATITPVGSMRLLSQLEARKLQDTSNSGLYRIFRKCALAVLTSTDHTEPFENISEIFNSFNIIIHQEHRGIKLELQNAPAQAFVDGKLILGIRENLCSVLRDILYVSTYYEQENFNNKYSQSELITNLIFEIIRHADGFKESNLPNIVVCWGGHSISREEYNYTKIVGYQLGLRKLDICTGCGPGAMKGPMKGAYIGHAKQRQYTGRYIGLTEPGIIASEPPNPIVNELIILPDIEKRLEAFVRLGHAIIIFPGGVGTCEELLYILGILMHPSNHGIPIPLILTGPESSRAYFEEIDQFIHLTLGEPAQQFYEIIIDDAERVAIKVRHSIEKVMRARRKANDAYQFHWQLTIPEEMQFPFNPTHDNMRNLQLALDMPAYLLAANIRKLMSGIVAGNIKNEAVQQIKLKGPYEISGSQKLMKQVDKLLTSFIQQHRMAAPSKKYQPCYKIIT